MYKLTSTQYTINIIFEFKISDQKGTGTSIATNNENVLNIVDQRLNPLNYKVTR